MINYGIYHCEGWKDIQVRQMHITITHARPVIDLVLQRAKNPS